ncbi:hypothetical protein AN958_01160 [Leucoagaricus sp. SymC.cos]|nr:hypothetical protein AN958_01160 [Leucoagaricus sp. SymC.cos]
MGSRERQNGQTKLPSRWPKNVHYLRSYQIHPSVTPVIRDFIQGNLSIATQLPVISRACVAIRPITDTAHPAYGQFGLFATSHIKSNTRILDYTGELHCDDRPTSDYDLSLYRFSDGVNVGIDARTSGNETRFINDYRGIAGRPNALFRDNRLSSGVLRMSIWSASEGIRKGDEILVSYGKSWWRARSETN